MTVGSAIYDDAYARAYAARYIAPWQHKHGINHAILDFLLGADHEKRWLDLACGQAWHFAQFAGRATMVGIDASAAQLARAAVAAPAAELRCQDMRDFRAPAAGFDLVTIFWGAYCYLADTDEVAALVNEAIGALTVGGSLYLEVLPIAAIDTFNASPYARATGFSCRRQDQTDRWQYRDAGGEHAMISPPLTMFMALLSDRFEMVRTLDDGCCMHHLVAYRLRAKQRDMSIVPNRS